MSNSHFLYLGIPSSCFKSLIVELIFNNEWINKDHTINKQQIGKTMRKYLFVISCNLVSFQKLLSSNLLIKSIMSTPRTHSHDRSSRQVVFCKKGVLINLTKITGKHLCQSLFFNKLQFYQKRDSGTVVFL